MRATTGNAVVSEGDPARADAAQVDAAPANGVWADSPLADGALADGVRAAVPAHAVLLVVALAAATVADGGYYAAGRILTLALVLAALGAAWWTRRGAAGPDLSRRGWLLALPAGALGLWIVVRAAVAVPLGAADAFLPALAALGTLATVVAVPAILRRTGPAGRGWLVNAAIAVGTLVALTAWAGVAWRLSRFAVLVDGRLWRGGSTLTYQNAAAALLVMLALLAIAFCVDGPGGRERSVPTRSPYRAVTAYLLLVGVGAAARAGPGSSRWLLVSWCSGWWPASEVPSPGWPRPHSARRSRSVR